MGGHLAGSTVGWGHRHSFHVHPATGTAGNGECLPCCCCSPPLGAGVAGYGAYGQQQQQEYANEDPHALSPTRSAFHPGPSTVSEHSSSYGASPYAPPIGRGPSPGPSVARTNTTNSSGGAGGGSAYYNHPRSTKEMEALGMRGGVHIMNPSQDREYSQHAYAGGAGVGEAVHQAYLAGGPSSSNFAGGGAGGRPGAVSPPGGSVVVHRDGGRVPIIEGEQEHVIEAEIPPTCDSLPAEERM